MAEMEEIEDTITTTYGAPSEKPAERQEAGIEEQSAVEKEAEVDEDVWMQPQQQYR